MCGRAPLGVGRSWNLFAQRNSRRHSFFECELLAFPASVSCASDSGSICSHPSYLNEIAQAGKSLRKIWPYWLHTEYTPISFERTIWLSMDSAFMGAERIVRLQFVTKKASCYRYSIGACTAGAIYGMCGNSDTELVVSSN